MCTEICETLKVRCVYYMVHLRFHSIFNEYNTKILSKI